VTIDFQFSIELLDRDAWLQYTPEFADYNYRQAWDFGIASAKRVGALCEHVAIKQTEQQIVALADVRIRKLPFIGGGIAYINGGPLVWKKAEQNAYQSAVCVNLVKTLVHEYVGRRKFALRIAPSIFCGETFGNDLITALISHGFVQSSVKKQTILIDLSQDEVAIRKNFHQKWRNCLNKSEKSRLTVRVGKDQEIFQEFIPLFKDLVAEKKFSVDLDSVFYANVQKVAANQEKYVVILAEYEGKPIAGHVASILGNTCVYLLGAANNVGREMNAAYLLQWKAIQLGKAAGCCWYDLGGIDPDGNKGVYNFKNRMGGREITMPGVYQLGPFGGWAMLTQLGEKMFTAFKPYMVRR
jgi:hypothetical protein